MSRIGAFVLLGGLVAPLLLSAGTPSPSALSSDPRYFWASPAEGGVASSVTAFAQIKRVAAYRHLPYGQVRQVVADNVGQDGSVDVATLNRVLDTQR